MLILSRRTNEKIMIGDNIQINILGINGNQVRIGFTAPQDISIHREEIYNKIFGQDTNNNNHNKEN